MGRTQAEISDMENTDSREYKNRINSDWHKAFPMLKRYSSVSFRMVADFMMIGINIERHPLSSSYYISLNLWPLWCSDIKQLNIPYVSIPLVEPGRRYRGMRFDIDKQYHKFYFNGAVVAARHQFGEFIKLNIPASIVFRLINRSLYNEIDLYGHNPVFVYRLYETKLAASLYLDDRKMEDLIRRQIEFETGYWDEEHFMDIFNRTIEEWKRELYERYSDRERFMETIRKNMELPKIKKLNEAHIYMDDFNYSKAFRPSGLWDRLQWMFFR